jgi:hypothetical protein
MTRTLRELWKTASDTPGGSSLVVGALLLCGLGGCLVTENTDFRSSASRPIPVAIRPLPYTRVPYVTDAFCADGMIDQRAMRFESVIDYQDVDQVLYARLVVNGRYTVGPQPVPTTGTTRREPTRRQQCVPYEALDLPCNLVELITSSELDKIDPQGRPAEGALDPDFGITQWLVRGPSADQPGANDNDCAALFLDGGV